MSPLLEESWRRCRQRYCDASLRRRRIIGLVGVYLAFYLLIDAQAVTRSYLLTPLNNLNVAEARSWLAGRLDLDFEPTPGKRPWDSGVHAGRVYNVFPPMFTLISAAVMTAVPDGVPNSVLVVLLALPLPGLAYAVFLRRTERVATAVLLSVGYLLGTSLLPLMNQGLRNGDVWRINHLLSQLGLLIFLADYFGRRRVWLGGIGLIVAAWSRQLTILYLLPLALIAAAREGSASRRFRLVSLAVVTAVLVALPATLNMLKFGHPLESGYRYIYEGRQDDPDDQPAQDARRGLFSPSFIPRNLYYMNLGLPYPDSPVWMLRFVPNPHGTGIWWTTPVLLFVLTGWRKLWAQRELRSLLLAAMAVFAVLMTYHTTGRAQLGYNRFSMDFVIVLLAVVAPLCDDPRRRWIAFGFVLWSVWYFRWAI